MIGLKKNVWTAKCVFFIVYKVLVTYPMKVLSTSLYVIKYCAKVFFKVVSIQQIFSDAKMPSHNRQHLSIEPVNNKSPPFQRIPWAILINKSSSDTKSLLKVNPEDFNITNPIYFPFNKGIISYLFKNGIFFTKH